MKLAIIYALLAAALFGTSIPVAKLLGGEISPVLLAGLLYLGSGLGLVLARLVRDRSWKPAGLERDEWPWLLGSILFGGVIGPSALMYGLAHASGANASLLLNFESVFTAVIAWLVFRESADRRLVLGMMAIFAGGVVLAWPGGTVGATDELWGMAAILAACLCWAIDNNLTRKVSSSDALYVAGSKGLIAGSVNTALALALGSSWPSLDMLATMLTVGLLGYGISLVLFVLALRSLGAARTGAYFSIAPFFGAAVAIALLGEQVSTAFWLAGALMGLGIWLHLSEHHEHEHTHKTLEHSHAHRHDAHHQHIHDSTWDTREPHVHRHVHAALTHKHPHYPDTHHRHEH